MHKFSPMLLAASATLAAGCATPPPAAPPEFSFHRATIVASNLESPLVLDGAPGKGQSAAAGAIGGAAVALTLGGLACLVTGPFMGACFGMLAPTIAVTAAGTAVVTAAIADTAEDVAAKRNLLRAASSAPTAHVRLAAKVLAQARKATGADVPYALQASADLQLMRLGDEKPSFLKRYQAVSPTKRTIAEWGASAGEPVRTALDGLLTKIASDMVAELMKSAPQRSSSFGMGGNALALAYE